MNGQRNVTAIELLDRIAVGCRMPDDCRMLLGLAPLGSAWQANMASIDTVWHGAIAAHSSESHNGSVKNLIEPDGHGHSDHATETLVDASELPEWFGVRVAHMIGIVDDWQAQDVGSDVLQTLLHQEILMFDAVGQDGHHRANAFSRRQALATLAALPLTFPISGRRLGVSGAATEFFLSRCAASLTACWHMLRGSDLDTIHRVLSSYLLELEGGAHRQSPYQESAARLASQAHRICGIIALHRNQLSIREHHCKRALAYAEAASDIPSRVSALISLASTYFYDARPAQAATVYEQALRFVSAVSPLQRSRIHAELSVVNGQLGRKQETIRSASLAEELYPDHPEQDRSFLYAEFTRASLTLERGLAYVALAERFPEQRFQRIASDIFTRVEHGGVNPIPDRIRFEIVNHQARVAVLLNDLDAFEVHLSRGANGVILLGSKQRQKELMTAWRSASDAWPHERRLKLIGERIAPAIPSLRQAIEGRLE